VLGLSGENRLLRAGKPVQEVAGASPDVHLAYSFTDAEYSRTSYTIVGVSADGVCI
jgi:hypothetical protein